MPIPNVATLYQKIRKGSEGGHEFSRLVSALLSAEYGSKGERLQLFSDASGDYNGLDAVIFGDEPFPEILIGFQYKFFPQNLSYDNKAKIKSSLEAARKSNQFMKHWILVTPEDFLKNDLEWFEKLKEKIPQSVSCDAEHCGVTPFTFDIVHWGHTKIVELCLKHEHIGRRYYAELFQDEICSNYAVEVLFDDGSDTLAFHPNFNRVTKIFRPQTEEEKLEEIIHFEAAFNSVIKKSASTNLTSLFKNLMHFFKKDKLLKEKRKIEILINGEKLTPKFPRKKPILNAAIAPFPYLDKYDAIQRCWFRIKIKNFGKKALENYKILLNFEGNFVNSGTEEPTISELINKTYPTHTNVYKNKGVLQPENPILVQGDLFICSKIFIEPVKECNSTIKIHWKLLAKDFSESGNLVINALPDYEDLEEVFYIQPDKTPYQEIEYLNIVKRGILKPRL